MEDKRNRGRRITDRITEAYYELMKIVAENNHERMFEYYVEDDDPGSRREGDFFVPSIRLFHHKPDLVSVLRQPFAFVQAPPRRDDESTIGLCFPVWVGATCCTVQRAQH